MHDGCAFIFGCRGASENDTSKRRDGDARFRKAIRAANGQGSARVAGMLEWHVCVSSLLETLPVRLWSGLERIACMLSHVITHEASSCTAIDAVLDVINASNYRWHG
jgi:hypothetical protein